MDKNDYRYIFSRKLLATLKPVIRGHIYVRVLDDDTLYVDIQNGLRCEVNINNISDKISRGYTTLDAAYAVSSEYKKIVNKHYFW